VANVPVPVQHDMVMQNQTTGAVDFLEFNGTQLVGSFMKNYGIAGWKIVASGDFNGDGNMDLVAQETGAGSFGHLDFLFLDAHANLIGSWNDTFSSSMHADQVFVSSPPLITTFVPAEVHGAGFFGTVPGQVGPTLVLQHHGFMGGTGPLEFLAYNGHGGYAADVFVANTVGIPTMVGVTGSSNAGSFPAFAGVGGPTNDNIVLQLANGSIDVIGFSGSMADGSLTMSASYLLPGTVGSPALFALNQDFSTFGVDSNVFATIDGTHRETVEMVGLTSSRQPDLLMFNSGVNDPPHRGDEVGTLLENFVLSSGWQIVDAGPVAQEIFPLV
jgi:hypothetical protein